MAPVKHRAAKCYFQRRSPSSLAASQATLKPPNMQAISGQKPGTAAERFIMSASAVDVSQAEGGEGAGGITDTPATDSGDPTAQIWKEQSTTLTRRDRERDRLLSTSITTKSINSG